MLKFAKMQGAGNDFILFDGTQGPLPQPEKLARAVCDRRFGIGADGLLIAMPDDGGGLQMLYYNADGSRAAMCGNGLRCFARYAREEGLVDRDVFTVRAADGVHQVQILREEGAGLRVLVGMGRAEFAPAAVPTLLPGPRVLEKELEVAGARLSVSCLRVGVPHAVLFVEALERVPLKLLGPKIERHPAFPQGINVDFVQPAGPNRLRIFTWERGAGHTLACGTGCCAAAAAALETGRCGAGRILLEAEGGLLEVARMPDGQLYLTGEADPICSGVVSEALLCRRGRTGCAAAGSASAG